MKWTILALLVAASAAFSGPADAAPEGAASCNGGDRRSCAYIIAATTELTSMLVTANPRPLQRHLHPRALWVSTRGEVRTGAQLIEAITRDAPRAAARLDQVSVHFFGDTAIVTWQESWTSPKADPASGRLAGVDTWSRHRGRWRIVATTEAHLPQ